MTGSLKVKLSHDTSSNWAPKAVVAEERQQDDIVGGPREERTVRAGFHVTERGIDCLCFWLVVDYCVLFGYVRLVPHTYSTLVLVAQYTLALQRPKVDHAKQA